MDLLTAIFVFLYGLAIGSFLNVCIYRLPKGESVIFTSSHCPQCNKSISSRDLIPVFSYLFLKGKCRSCNASISPIYPAIELLNAVLYLLLFLIYGLSAKFVFFALLVSILVIITFVDARHKIIPDELVISAIVAGVLYHIYGFSIMGTAYWQDAISALIGFFVASGVLFILGIIVKGGMGGGDVKMMAAFGLCLGWGQILLALFIASLYGSAFGGIIMLQKKAGLKSEVPFGPFLAAGIFSVICFGDALVNWYMSLIIG